MNVQNLDQFTSMGKENVDALVKSSALAVKGFEELTKIYTGLANRSIEQTTTAVKALTGAKDPAEFQSIYTNLAKANFESFVADSRKLQELTNSIVAESLAPLSARFQALTGIFKVS